MTLIDAEEVGRRLGRSAETINRWRKTGKIEGVKLPSGRFMYREVEIEQLIKEGQSS